MTANGVRCHRQVDARTQRQERLCSTHWYRTPEYRSLRRRYEEAA